MRGVVIKSTGSWYSVRTEDKTSIQCRIKGKFRLDDIKHTNPIAVGDWVEYTIEPEHNTGIIHTIEDRKNYIIRKSSNLSKQTHIIASNIDQALLVASLVQPQTSLGFIDRFILTAEAYHIPTIIVFNKADLYHNHLQAILDDTLEIYQNMGYTCFSTSVPESINTERLKQILTNKTTLISGHSGVGKSSLLNHLSNGLNLKTGSISEFSNKGTHTTTFAEMFELSFGGYIIDTPGIKEFGLVDFNEAEISHYFLDMKPYINQCRFNNCKHLNEPHCAVKNAVEIGLIREERYHSYINILTKQDLYT
ncbi:MAG: ribosome small subunit-dependent GTPase A [Bacteroidetes bacterium]|nr:MAG: ribosome small subunit-dependent GTPase A [Bacteroidota bacterium]